jgi:hypothetical protein
VDEVVIPIIDLDPASRGAGVGSAGIQVGGPLEQRGWELRVVGKHAVGDVEQIVT